jgi:putative ABC transport system permease protein
MNLAIRDIRHNLGRFALTTFGIGMLLMVVMGMGGIYRGLVEDAVFLLDRLDADLWVVQRDTRGPFAEVSRVPSTLEDRLLAVPGVAKARRFLSHTIQREYEGKPLRIVVQGLAWPEDKGEWLPLVAGRPLAAGHFEMIADASLGLPLGTSMRLGKDDYTVVGITKGMMAQSGDGMAFFTVRDAQAIQFDTAGTALRLERAAREKRASQSDMTRKQPSLLERADSPASELAVISPPTVSAVMVWREPGADRDAVQRLVNGWGDVTAHTDHDQRDFLIKGLVDKSRRQIGLFRGLLVAISAVVMSLILYTLTLDKMHDIAMLKLMGARTRVILRMILEQAILMGALGYAIAYAAGTEVFPKFPRKVVILHEDLFALAGIVLLISILASGLGIWKAIKIKPNEVLS